MKILKLVLISLHISGQSLYHTKWDQFMSTLRIGFMGIVIFGLGLSFFKNMHGISDMITELGLEIAFLSAFIKSLIYYTKKTKYLVLVKQLQENVNNREIVGKSHFYEIAEKQCQIFVKLFTILVIAAGIFINSTPVIGLIYKQVIMGVQVNATDWTLPLKIYLFYDNTMSPGYEIDYSLIVISVTAMVITVVGFDSLFIGIALNIEAGFKDLQEMILDLDSDEKTMIEFQNGINKCVDFHNFMLECQSMHQDINSEMIFVTMAEALFLLIYVLLGVSRLDQSNKGFLIIFYAIVLSAVLLLLFIYAYTGNLVTTEGSNVATAAYNGLWYNRSSIERRYYILIIQMAQDPKYFRALYYINCSMENFVTIVKAAFSALTIMQSIEDFYRI